ncbi:MAG TPA: hypothetical protein VD999_05740 [Vitreimonas sp.]|nr:hypothetical protein [Vitreimonas sp.]
MFDLIVTWPTHCDYPIFRKLIRENRKRFGEVIITFSDANNIFNRVDFVKQTMKKDDVTFLRANSRGGDWRNEAIQESLKESQSKWVLFIEQDFIIHKPEQFFFNLNIEMPKYDVIGFKEGERLHPGFLLIRRECLNQTCLDFGIVPNKLDHFGLITKDITRLGFKVGLLDDLGLERKKHYYHMNGLSHNLTLMQQGEKVTYQPDMFLSYLRSCAQAGIELPSDFFLYYHRMKETNA